MASKEPLWVVCGFRRWLARPIFSQNNLNCDKNKYERFLQAGAGNFVVASCYGPATYAPSPVLLFRERAAGLQLVAQGSVGTVDVDRIVLKRVILTGYPARVHKRNAVIKHMFRRPEVPSFS